MSIDLTDRWNVKVLEALSVIEPGWATADELAWQIFHSHEVIRQRTRKVLDQLADDAILETFSVRHRGLPMTCYRIDEQIAEKCCQLAVAANETTSSR